MRRRIAERRPRWGRTQQEAAGNASLGRRSSGRRRRRARSPGCECVHLGVRTTARPPLAPHKLLELDDNVLHAVVRGAFFAAICWTPRWARTSELGRAFASSIEIRARAASRSQPQAPAPGLVSGGQVSASPSAPPAGFPPKGVQIRRHLNMHSRRGDRVSCSSSCARPVQRGSLARAGGRGRSSPLRRPGAEGQVEH